MLKTFGEENSIISLFLFIIFFYPNNESHMTKNIKTGFFSEPQETLFEKKVKVA